MEVLHRQTSEHGVTPLRTTRPQTASGLGGYAGNTAFLTLSTAEQASIHGRIMLASGVIIPQRQALRAAAFPACLVMEAIRAAVTDADRQLLQHRAHRQHPTSTARALRYPQCGSEEQLIHPATPSERP